MHDEDMVQALRFKPLCFLAENHNSIMNVFIPPIPILICIMVLCNPDVQKFVYTTSKNLADFPIKMFVPFQKLQRGYL